MKKKNLDWFTKFDPFKHIKKKDISLKEIKKKNNKLIRKFNNELKNKYGQIGKLLHPYGILLNSPWPIIISIFLIDLFVFLVCIIYNVKYSNILFEITLLFVATATIYWFKELIEEGYYKGEHTEVEISNLMIGFILFVISEIVIFLILFFCYYYNSMAPNIEIGGVYPPFNIKVIDPYSLPLFNTALLYFSGITLSISQNYMISRLKDFTKKYMKWTIYLALLFTLVQLFEYKHAFYTIIDSVYGTNFYILTGFHGIHVIIGTTLIIVTYFRFKFDHFQENNQVGFHAAAIYWAFVDWLWLFIMAFVYLGFGIN